VGNHSHTHANHKYNHYNHYYQSPDEVVKGFDEEEKTLRVKSRQIIDTFFEEVRLFLVPVSHGLKRWNET